MEGGWEGGGFGVTSPVRVSYKGPYKLEWGFGVSPPFYFSEPLKILFIIIKSPIFRSEKLLGGSGDLVTRYFIDL